MINKNTKTKLQEVYFDICDLLEGELPSGYENLNEVYQDIKDKLEEIEEAIAWRQEKIRIKHIYILPIII